VIATVDLGTTFTKVALWDHDGLVAHSRVPIATTHPAPGWAEQDPAAWWNSVVGAFADLRSRVGERLQSVDALGCTGARQTVVLTDADGRPFGPALAWTDRRAVAEAVELADDLGGPGAVFDRTGVPLDAGAVSAKVAWLAVHHRDQMELASWLLAPRDLVAWRLTGEVVTDPTMASRSGLYDLDGHPVAGLAGAAAAKLPPVVPSDEVSGRLQAVAASELGLVAGTPVVIGAGDRACEVVGTGADASRAMVSWGTTANLSSPRDERPAVRPTGMVLSRAARTGWLIEGGLSAAGSFLEWLGRMTGHTPSALAALAEGSPPGARGVTALPWLDGARAPWWRHQAGAGFVGLSSEHGLADLARALFESVGWEVRRCLDAIEAGPGGGAPLAGMALAGTGAGVRAWVEVLTGITGLPANRRQSGQAASAGAALLAASAVGAGYDLETMDPVDELVEPNPVIIERYAALTAGSDRLTRGMLDLTTGSDDVGSGGPR
jgi:xylulokinase